MVFVLAAMFFLLALATAAFTAAGLNRGVSQAQRDRQQLDLYVNSMERTIRSALEDAWTASLNSEALPVAITDEIDTLGGLILLEAYNTGSVAKIITSEELYLSSIYDDSVQYTITISSASTPLVGADEDGNPIYRDAFGYDEDGNQVYSVFRETFSIIKQPYERCERYGDEPEPPAVPHCEPMVVTMSGELRVLLTTVYTTAAGNELSTDTMMTFGINGIRLEEEILTDCDDFDNHDYPYPHPTDESMKIVQEATWEVIRHETEPFVKNTDDPEE